MFSSGSRGQYSNRSQRIRVEYDNVLRVRRLSTVNELAGLVLQLSQSSKVRCLSRETMDMGITGIRAG